MPAPGTIPIGRAPDPYAEDSSYVRFHLLSLLGEQVTLDGPAALAEALETSMKWVLAGSERPPEVAEETAPRSSPYL